MIRYVNIAVAAAGFLFCESLMAAKGKIHVADFDKNKNGLIDSGNEFESFALAINPITVGAIDKDGDGILTDVEIADIKGLKLQRIQAEQADFGIKQSYSFAELSEGQPNVDPYPSFPGGTPKPQQTDSWHWYLRSTKEDLGIAAKAKPGAKAAPAVFSLAKDYQSNASTWLASGTLMGLKRIHYNPEAESKGGLASIYFVPSLSINKLETSGNPAKEVDSLILRAGTEALFQGNNKAFFVRANPTLATDTDFRSLLGGLEFQFEPYFNGTAIGSSRDLPGGKIHYLFRPLLNIESGGVFDAGEKTALLEHEHEWFSRIGPQLRLEFWSDEPWLERFGLTTSFSHYEALGPDVDSGDFFDATLSFRLDEKGDISLTTKYQHGEIPFIQDHVDALTVGFGIKF
jgi:hypothetical protein